MEKSWIFTFDCAFFILPSCLFTYWRAWWWKHRRLWRTSPNRCSHDQTDRWAHLLTDYQQVSQPNGGEQFLINEKTNKSYTTHLHPVTETKVTHKLILTVFFLFEWQPDIYKYEFEYLQPYSMGLNTLCLTDLRWIQSLAV